MQMKRRAAAAAAVVAMTVAGLAPAASAQTQQYNHNGCSFSKYTTSTKTVGTNISCWYVKARTKWNSGGETGWSYGPWSWKSTAYARGTTLYGQVKANDGNSSSTWK